MGITDNISWLEIVYSFDFDNIIQYYFDLMVVYIRYNKRILHGFLIDFDWVMEQTDLII